MNILVANDDGIEAIGLKNLVDGLTEIANIYVVAPHTQKSACGHGITISRPIAVEEVKYEGANLAFSLEGTPADCVKIGLELLRMKNIEIDMVFSGINLGANMGTDVLYSGTVSAAVEGALCGKPAVAVSIDSPKPIQYETAKTLAVRAAKMDHEGFDNEVILNINVPNLPKDEIKGVKVVGLGVREYEEWFEEVGEENGKVCYKYSGRPVFHHEAGSDDNDIGASQNAYASITPLHYDFTRYDLLEKLKKTGISKDIV